MVHDRMSRTRLLGDFKNGKAVVCTACHGEPVSKAAGRPGVLNLSAAIHGLHANYLTGRGADACVACHLSGPSGRTRCLRGVHATAGLTCVSCHGIMEDHALGLLLAEREGKEGPALRLMRHLSPRGVADVSLIRPRVPFLNEPDCLACHREFEHPEKGAAAFNRWAEGPGNLYRERTGEGGVRCQACPGAPMPSIPPGIPMETTGTTSLPASIRKHLSRSGQGETAGSAIPLIWKRSCTIPTA